MRCVSAVSSKESAPALSAAAAAGGAPGGSYEPLLTLALDHAAALLRGATADEVEGAFTLVLSFFAPLPAETQRALAERIVAAATAAADAKAAGLRLRVCVRRAAARWSRGTAPRAAARAARRAGRRRARRASRLCTGDSVPPPALTRSSRPAPLPHPAAS